MARPSRKPLDEGAQFLASLTEQTTEEMINSLPMAQTPVVSRELTVSELLQGVVKPKSIEYDFIPDDAVFVLTEKRIDSTTTIRSRIEKTELVCELCGKNFAVDLGRSYEQLSDTDKLLVPKLMDEHFKNTHTLSSKNKITGAEYKQILREGTNGNN